MLVNYADVAEPNWFRFMPSETNANVVVLPVVGVVVAILMPVPPVIAAPVPAGVTTRYTREPAAGVVVHVNVVAIVEACANVNTCPSVGSIFTVGPGVSVVTVVERICFAAVTVPVVVVIFPVAVTVLPVYTGGP